MAARTLALAALLLGALVEPAAAHGVAQDDAAFFLTNVGPAVGPFLYLGAWYGLAAGALALALLTVAWLALRAPLADLAGSYGSGFTLQGVDAMQAGIVVLGATLLGWFGAGVATGHFLRQTRPVSA